MRLDKYLSECGLGTRSEVKSIIKSGKVSVNDIVVKKPNENIDLKDYISCNGEKLEYKQYRYYLINKPKGCVCALKDNLYPTIMEYLQGENIKDCAPVGRLDLDTEGALLVTNDGRLAHKLLNPSKHVKKIYLVTLDKECPESAIKEFEDGIDIGDEKITLPAILNILDDRKTARLMIHEGRFHQVKRMFKAVGCTVIELKRESFGNLTVEGLKLGEYKEILRSDIYIEE